MTGAKLGPEPTVHARSVRPSGIREIFNLALGRPDVLHLEVGEPDFGTPDHIVEAAFEAARAGSGYTATIGLRHVREAAAQRLSRVHALDVDPDEVFVTQGAAQGIALTITACVQAGDEVLIPDPAWPNYEMLVVALGAVPVRYPLRAQNGFFPDPDEVAALISGRTRLMILNSPANPAGVVFSREDLERLVSLARAAGVVVVSDEVYDEIVFDGRRPGTAADIDAEHVVAVWSCSKSYAMTGWRVGYLIAPRSLAPAMTAIQEASITCVSSVTQAAARAALTGPQLCVTSMRDAYRHRRDVLVDLLAGAAIDVSVPQGAFYLMVPLADGADSRSAALDLVEHGVATAPGSAFGDAARSHLRLSLASSETTIVAAARRIVDWYGRTDGGLAVPRAPA